MTHAVVPSAARPRLFRRWLAMLLMVLAPLQLSLAAVHEYSAHHLVAGDADTPLFHTHGHLGDHLSAVHGDHGIGDLATDTDPDDDSGHIHFGHIHFMAASALLAPPDLSHDRMRFTAVPFPSIPPRRLDRPPLSARR